MAMILQSFMISFAVASRMVFPIIGIFIVSNIVIGLLDRISGGLAGAIGGDVVAMLIMLVGIRAAFAVLGDNRGVAWDILILNSVVYALVMWVVLSVLMVVVLVGASMLSSWQVSGNWDWRLLVFATERVQSAFVLGAFGLFAIVGFVVYTVTFTLFAVPLAAAARAGTQGTRSTGFMFGLGRCFLPVFLVFATTFFLQFFTGILAAFTAFLPLMFTLASILISQTVPDFDLEVILLGLASAAALLWLHAWMWSVMAVAFKSVEATFEPKRQVPAEPQMTTDDFRALRKARS